MKRRSLQFAALLAVIVPLLYANTPTRPADASSPYANHMYTNTVAGGRFVAVDLNRVTGVGIAAADSGGLYRSGAFATWGHLDGFAPRYMSDVRYSPDGTTIVAAVAFDPTVRHLSSSLLDTGIWRSADGGNTWQQASVTKPTTWSCAASVGAYGISWSNISGESGRVYVGTACGLAVSTDWGVNFTLVNPNSGFSTKSVAAVVAHPGRAKEVHMCGNFGYRKATQDSLGTWTVTNPSPLPNSLTCDPNANVHGISIYYRRIPLVTTREAVYISPYTRRIYQLQSGTWTDITPAAEEIDNYRSGVARVYPAANGDSNKYDVYHVGGRFLYRNRCDFLTACAAAGWTQVDTNGHDDRSDLAYDVKTNCPHFVSSDGGLGNLTSGTSCAMTESLTGAALGLDALQIYDVAGEPNSTTSTDLYFGTQDNSLYASSNDGATWPTKVGTEGFAIQVPTAPGLPGPHPVTFLNCAGTGCGNNTAGRLFSPLGANIGANWVDPAACFSNPFLVPGSETLTTSTWLEIANPPVPPATGCSPTQFNLYKGIKTSTGLAWTRLLTLPPVANGRPRFSGPASNPTVYMAVYKSGDAKHPGDIGITQIKNIFSGTPVVTPVNLGLNSVSTKSAGYLFGDPIFEVDPFNANHLITGDQVDDKVKETWDGGAHWRPNTALTNLVTSNGQFLFDALPDGDTGRANWSELQSISFDPKVRDRIFIGTDTAGILATSDGGENWTLVPDTKGVVTSPVDFFNDPEDLLATVDRQIVASYGRGLWRLTFNRANLELTSTLSASSTTVGSIVTLTETVHNAGTLPVPAPVLTVGFSTNLSFVPSGSSPLCTAQPSVVAGRVGAGNRVRCAGISLGAGGSQTFTMRISANAVGTLYGLSSIVGDPLISDSASPTTATSFLHVS